MQYKFNNSKVVFVKQGTYFSMNQQQMSRMLHLLPKAMKEHNEKYPIFQSKHWKDNGNGTCTTTKRR